MNRSSGRSLPDLASLAWPQHQQLLQQDRARQQPMQVGWPTRPVASSSLPAPLPHPRGESATHGASAGLVCGVCHFGLILYYECVACMCVWVQLWMCAWASSFLKMKSASNEIRHYSCAVTLTFIDTDSRGGYVCNNCSQRFHAYISQIIINKLTVMSCTLAGMANGTEHDKNAVLPASDDRKSSESKVRSTHIHTRTHTHTHTIAHAYTHTRACTHARTRTYHTLKHRKTLHFSRTRNHMLITLPIVPTCPHTWCTCSCIVEMCFTNFLCRRLQCSRPGWTQLAMLKHLQCRAALFAAGELLAIQMVTKWHASCFAYLTGNRGLHRRLVYTTFCPTSDQN